MRSLLERYPALLPVRGDIEKALELLTETYRKGGKLLCCGNGGSASDCEHIVGELMKSFKLRRPLNPGCLNTATKERLLRGLWRERFRLSLSAVTARFPPLTQTTVTHIWYSHSR